MRKWFNIIFFMISLTSCQQAKDKGHEIMNESVNKSKVAGKRIWELTFNKAENALTKIKKTTFQDVFGNRDSLKVQEIDGRWINFPLVFIIAS